MSVEGDDYKPVFWDATAVQSGRRDDGPVPRLFYVDESRDRGKKGHRYFVGLLADGEGVARSEAALDKIAEHAWDEGLARWGTELHAAEIFQWNEGLAARVYPAASRPSRGDVVGHWRRGQRGHRPRREHAALREAVPRS